MDRREVLKTMGIGAIGLMGGCNFADEPHIRLKSKMVGCIGKSTDIKVSHQLFNDIWSSIPDDKAKATCSLGGATAVMSGRILEFNALKTEYKATSETDLLLRMFNREGLRGIKKIFENINYGAITGAISENDDQLWLFRQEQPLQVVDLRKELGQVFFFPEVENYRMAVKNQSNEKLKDVSIIEFPDCQAWSFNFDPERKNPSPHSLASGNCNDGNWEIRKFRVDKTKFYDKTKS